MEGGEATVLVLIQGTWLERIRLLRTFLALAGWLEETNHGPRLEPQVAQSISHWATFHVVAIWSGPAAVGPRMPFRKAAMQVPMS